MSCGIQVSTEVCPPAIPWNFFSQKVSTFYRCHYYINSASKRVLYDTGNSKKKLLWMWAAPQQDILQDDRVGENCGDPIGKIFY